MKNIVIMVCSDFEWDVIIASSTLQNLKQSKIYGDWFIDETLSNEKRQAIWFHGGWGKIASAGSTQFAIDTWHPELIINIGTCGGFNGLIKLYDTVLVNETIVYDLIDRIGEPENSIQQFRTRIDLTWLKNKEIKKLRRVRIATADQDLDPTLIKELHSKYGVVVGDWESGAISWVAERNNTKKLLIIRGVSDIVGSDIIDVYGVDQSIFKQRVNRVMAELISLVNEFVVKFD